MSEFEDPEGLFDVFDETPSDGIIIQDARERVESRKRVYSSISEDNEKKEEIIEEDIAIISSDKKSLTDNKQPPTSTTSPSQIIDLANSSPLPISSASLTSLADEDSLFSHYVEQQVETHTIVEGNRSCIVEICYPPFWDEKKGSALLIKTKAQQEEEKKEKKEESLASSSSSSHSLISSSTSSSSSSSSSLPSSTYTYSMPTNPAKTYPFTLDPFQLQSILSLERNQSVLVSAHTSAGKTVVAEYAIAMALKANQRVIYTSPIKALSNQKYRELYEEFGSVGLMTGDITLNPSASCLVMTTEILRNMLYRGSEVVREVSTIIYDEIHYMRNKERGVVWEETIILLPHSVRFVFLSATIPNAAEFACWIAKLHSQPVNVVYTDYRPTPLQHYLYPAGADGLYLVVDDQGLFREDNFQKALTVLSVPDASASLVTGGEGMKQGNNKKKRKSNSGPTDIYKIVRMIMDRHYDPVIIFSFSKRECETHALAMSKLDFNEPDEKKLIETIFQNAIDSLNDDDKQLPQVVNILPLLKRGIAIHHSGLLPLLKELVEILFQEGLIKCLFSTETFSMGLNMPAKTVVFTSVKKWDGIEFRIVSSGEYIQMSGRAGRRGLDERGIVICMMDEQLQPDQAKNMIKGESDILNSTFRLSYNMLLNLLRVEDQNAIKLMLRSFHQFQSTRKQPAIERKIKKLEAEKNEIIIENENNLNEYILIKEGIEKYREKNRNIWSLPTYSVPFLNAGRLVRVKTTEVSGREWGWGVIINYTKKSISKSDMVEGQSNLVYVIDVLVNALTSSIPSIHTKKPTPSPSPAIEDAPNTYIIISISLSDIYSLSSLRLYLPATLKSAADKKKLGFSLHEVIHNKMKGIENVPLLDPIEDMKVSETHATEIKKYNKRLQLLESRLKEHSYNKVSIEQRQIAVAAYEKKKSLNVKLIQLNNELSAANSDLNMIQQLKYMQIVLRRLDHTTNTNVINIKGRVAAEISTSDEILVTECLFNGLFLDLPTPVAVALCSCLVFNEKVEESSTLKLREELNTAYRQLIDTAKRIATIQSDARLPIDIDNYITHFSPALMEVVYSWCQGAKFSEICKMTDIFEGTIIRALRRLEELLRQLATACKSVGNRELEEKFTLGIELLKRDIVFAASLYL